MCYLERIEIAAACTKCHLHLAAFLQDDLFTLAILYSLSLSLSLCLSQQTNRAMCCAGISQLHLNLYKGDPLGNYIHVHVIITCQPHVQYTCTCIYVRVLNQLLI